MTSKINIAFGFILSLLTIVPLNAATTTPPNDAEIAKIVATVNEGEINLANKALETTKNAEVKKFAEHMILDHKMNNEKVSAISTKNNMTPADSTQSLALKKQGEKSLTTLKALKGQAFDKAYVTEQMNIHKQVLQDLRTKLIPAAKNPDLKSHLEMTAKKVEGHMEHAKTLQTTL